MAESEREKRIAHFRKEMKQLEELVVKKLEKDPENELRDFLYVGIELTDKVSYKDENVKMAGTFNDTGMMYRAFCAFLQTFNDKEMTKPWVSKETQTLMMAAAATMHVVMRSYIRDREKGGGEDNKGLLEMLKAKLKEAESKAPKAKTGDPLVDLNYNLPQDLKAFFKIDGN